MYPTNFIMDPEQYEVRAIRMEQEFQGPRVQPLTVDPPKDDSVTTYIRRVLKEMLLNPKGNHCNLPSKRDDAQKLGWREANTEVRHTN